MIPGLSPQANQYYLDNPVEYSQDFLKLRNDYVDPYSYQQKVINFLPLMESHIENQVRILLVLGARQIFGKSTTASMIGAWYPPMHDYSNTIIISHRQRRADKMLNNIKQYYRKKPTLRDMTKLGGHANLKWSNTEIELTNEAIVASLTEGNDADSSVGDATNLVIIDEVARFKNADSIKAAIMPTIFETDGVIIMFSSSWGCVGKGQFWADIVKASRENGSKNLVELDAIQCLDIQRNRWSRLHGEKKAQFLYNKKIEFLEEQKRMMGRYVYEMQYMNSFDTGLEGVFDLLDLDKCFTGFVPFVEGDQGRMYINIVDYGKSVRTGDKSVLSTYDVTDLDMVQCVARNSYSLNYKDVIPKIEERVLRFPGKLCCDIGGGENQLETLTDMSSLRRIGVHPIGMIFSGSLKKASVQTFEDKGIIRKTFSKNDAVLRLQSYIQKHNIEYCKNCNQKQYENYIQITTKSGLVSFSHPPNGHDDEIDTDLMLMALISEMQSNMEDKAYSAGITPVGTVSPGVNIGETSIIAM